MMDRLALKSNVLYRCWMVCVSYVLQMLWKECIKIMKLERYAHCKP